MKAFEDGVFNVFSCEWDDIFYLEPKNQDRIDFLQNVYKVYPANPASLNRRVEILYQCISLWIAVAFKNKEKEGLIRKILDVAITSPTYLISKKHRTTKFREFIASHDYDMALQMVKSVNGVVPSKVCTIMCQRVRYHKVIYIPRTKKTLTIESLKQTLADFMEYDDKEFRSFCKNTPEPHSSKCGIDWLISDDSYEEVLPIYSSQKIVKTKKKSRSKLFSNEERKENQLDEEYEEKTERLLKLRIISPFDLELVDEMEKLRLMPSRKVHKVKAIIIHIHGGGFVTMSSDQHQTYTRQWSQDVGIPVFMISYRLSPEWRYPDALDDWWQTYNWIIEYWVNALGIEPERIFLSGDSAGGNLAVALTALWICKRARVPDALFTFYPALMTWIRGFIPSRILSFDDHILNYTMLTFCLNAYWKDINSKDHEFMWPILFPDKLLSKFPSFKWFVAGSDPLRDDGYKFAYRLFKLNRNVSIAEFKRLPHGFLNFDVFPFLAEESSRAIKQSSMWFKLEMMRQSKSNADFSSSNSDDSDDNEVNHIVYKNHTLASEQEIMDSVESEVPLWFKLVNALTLPFLKIFF